MNIRGVGREELAWLEMRAGCILTSGAEGIEATDADGLPRGQVAFDLWTENAVFVHMAVDTPLAFRKLIPAAFDYGFAQTQRGVLIGVIPSHNKRSVSMTLAMGFRETHRIRDGWLPGDDLVFFEMRRDECRYLNGMQRRAA